MSYGLKSYIILPAHRNRYRSEWSCQGLTWAAQLQNWKYHQLMLNLRNASTWNKCMASNLVLSYEVVLKQKAFVLIQNENYQHFRLWGNSASLTSANVSPGGLLFNSKFILVSLTNCKLPSWIRLHRCI